MDNSMPVVMCNPKDEEVCVAFCANRAILPGLHASIGSLLANCSKPDTLRIFVFSDDLTEADFGLREKIMEAPEGGRGAYLVVRAIDCSRFMGLRSLQGDWMTYFRLMLPDLLRQFRYVIYLDSDLVVNLDIIEILEYVPENEPFAAVGVGRISTALEAHFFQSLGLAPNDRSLNAGVLVFNTEVCYRIRFFETCMAFAEQHTNDLLSADQTVLTALFSRSFRALPERFNRALYASSSPPDDRESAIFHFVGSPKPWDLWGSIVHRSAAIWRAAISGGYYNRRRWLLKNIGRICLRTWYIRRSYAREILRRVRDF